MKKGRCSKFYPKEFQEETTFTHTGFTVYRRRDTGIYIRRDNHNLDNRWVVPHNLELLKKYQAHINVEYVNKSRLLKYLCKYVNKGPDQANVIFERIKKGQDAPINDQTRDIDEIKEYLDCIYICEQDALWRLLGYEIHYHWPPVERLPVHLPLMNLIKIKKEAKLRDVISDPKNQKTMLTEWFVANKEYNDAKDLTYCEFPLRWRWDESNKKWIKHRHGFKIGRLYYVHPTEGERFYLRMLLMIVKGATSYVDLRTYNGITYQTFKEACAARGLLNDDNEWYKTFQEATNWATASQLRNLFTTMLTYCDLKDETQFFEKNWTKMIDDIEKQLKLKYYPINYTPTEAELQDVLLQELEDIFCKNGQHIENYKLPRRSTQHVLDTTNRLIQEELNYDIKRLEEEANKLYLKLNKEQKEAFHTIIDSVINNKSQFYFITGHGGTGKTFLWNTIVSYLRAKKNSTNSCIIRGSIFITPKRTHCSFKI